MYLIGHDIPVISSTTKGEVIKYEGQVIDAFFHSNSGGKAEIPANVWGGTDFPYLQVVETSGEEDYSQYSSEVNLTKNDFETAFRKDAAVFTITEDGNPAFVVDIQIPAGSEHFDTLIEI
jgi:SpoIID/LytB domain protein